MLAEAIGEQIFWPPQQPRVAGATTSKNFDGAPMGFRVWDIGPERPMKHEYVPVKGAKPPEKK